MKQTILFLPLLFTGFLSSAQNFQSLDTINPPASFDNIYSRPIHSDSLSSSVLIFIKKEVKPHKHVFHTEQVYIVEGEGEMVVGEKKMPVKKGDMILIPKGMVHSLSVTSKAPVKVLSVQAPMFDGKDRVMVEPGAK